MILRQDLKAEDRVMIEKWIVGAGPMDDNEKSVLRQLKAEVQQLVLKFPPGCVVSANRVIGIPGPGKFGIVLSYIESRENGMILRVGDLEAAVKKEPAMAAECRPQWLDVVAYREHRSAADIRGVIAN